MLLPDRSEGVLGDRRRNIPANSSVSSRVVFQDRTSNFSGDVHGNGGLSRDSLVIRRIVANMRLLLVEDTEDVADAIVASFERRGDAVDLVTSVDEAKSAIAVQEYDVILLDIGLPDGLGTEVLRSARDRGIRTPILMLTARSEIEDRVAALDKGADDYLVKPFDLRELHARVRAMVRRQDADRSGIIEFGDIMFDPAGLTVEVSGNPISLARREFNLLEILMINRERVVPKEKIFGCMFSFNDEDVNLNAVELYVGRLRKKLCKSRVAIKTLRGLGYQLVNDD